MNRIPVKYLKAQNIGEAMLNIRRWISLGLTVENMARQITQRYRKASEEDKAALGKLLVCVYDFGDNNTAKRCADLFGIETENVTKVGQTLSYKIFKQHYTPVPDKWLDHYHTRIQYNNGIQRLPVEQEHSKLLVLPGEEENILAVDICNKCYFYCIVESDMTVHLIAICEHNEEIHICEEVPDTATVPFYEATSASFISPVYMLKVMKKILEYCLERIGYPNVNIKLSVLFSREDTIFVNRDLYKEGGAHANQWKDIEVYDYQTFPWQAGLRIPSLRQKPYLLTKVNYTESIIMNQLIYSIRATVDLFRELRFRNSLNKHSHCDLTKLVKLKEIFSEFKEFKPD